MHIIIGINRHGLVRVITAKVRCIDYCLLLCFYVLERKHVALSIEDKNNIQRKNTWLQSYENFRVTETSFFLEFRVLTCK